MGYLSPNYHLNFWAPFAVLMIMIVERFAHYKQINIIPVTFAKKKRNFEKFWKIIPTLYTFSFMSNNFAQPSIYIRKSNKISDKCFFYATSNEMF